MEIKTYCISIGVVWLTILITDYVGHRRIFSGMRKKFGEDTPVVEPAPGTVSWRILAALLYSIFFVQLYTLNFIGTGPTLGMQFGLLVGCLISIPRLLHRRVRTPLRWELEIISPLITVAESGFAGILVGWLFQ